MGSTCEKTPKAVLWHPHACTYTWISPVCSHVCTRAKKHTHRLRQRQSDSETDREIQRQREKERNTGTETELCFRNKQLHVIYQSACLEMQNRKTVTVFQALSLSSIQLFNGHGFLCWMTYKVTFIKKNHQQNPYLVRVKRLLDMKENPLVFKQKGKFSSKVKIRNTNWIMKCGTLSWSKR